MVVACYLAIQEGKTRAEKDQANAYIVQFLASDQAWAVSEQLLVQGQTVQTKFLGA
jgi:uncharacterized protein YggU (UPF0235/DUF167 family)